MIRPLCPTPSELMNSGNVTMLAVFAILSAVHGAEFVSTS